MAGQAGFLGLLMLALTFSPPAQGAELVWDANPEPTVVGYRVYRGGASRDYTNIITVAEPSAVISDLVAGTTLYFAVTALDALGMESGFSDEVTYLVPAAFGQMQIGFNVAGLFQLTGTGLVGHTYEIQATNDLILWTTIDTQTVGVTGAIAFTDFDAPNHSARFYRTRDTQP